MRCSRSGGITRSSPTPTIPSMLPISPIAATPSSKPCSPTSSTDPWRTCRRGVSGRTRRGSCAPRSPTTCCAPPASSPAPPTPSHEDQRCGDASSTSQPGWPGPNADPSCTYQRTGPGHSIGSHCGATPSATAHQPPRPSDHPPRGPTEHHRKSWADQRLQAAHDPEHGKNQSRNTSTTSIHGSRLTAPQHRHPEVGRFAAGNRSGWSPTLASVKLRHGGPPPGSSALLVAPTAQLCCDLVEIGHCTGGHPDHKVEALVLRRANPLSVDGQERPAGCPRKSLVSVHQRVIPCQRMQQRGGLNVEIRVGIVAKHPGAGPRQSRFKQAVVPDHDIACNGLSGNFHEIFEVQVVSHASLRRSKTLASSLTTRCSAAATLALCARRAMYSSMADSAIACIDRPSAAACWRSASACCPLGRRVIPMTQMIPD